ncbi:MAG: hypothetical protein HYU66_04895 [Armatimonadetes bacterium]|nr:hypothetical protein [Armatimonadota bacterium]
MQTLRIHATAEEDGKVTLDHLPVRAGEAVEVIVLLRHLTSGSKPLPLRGLVLRYDRPFDPAVDPDDWQANR